MKTVAVVVILAAALAAIYLYRKKLGAVGTLAIAAAAGFIGGAITLLRGTSRKIDEASDEKVLFEAVKKQKESLDKRVESWKRDVAQPPELPDEEDVDNDRPDDSTVDWLTSHSRR